jgi:hypothetical protein
MDRRLRPVVGAVAFSGVFITGVLTAGNASAAERAAAPVGDTAPNPAVAPVRSLLGVVLTTGKQVATEEHSHGPRCDSSQFRGSDNNYPGLSVSALYDKVFRSGTAMPYLSSRVPQSLATWSDWDGNGHDMLLLGEYRNHEDAYLVGIDPDNHDVLGTVRVASSHLGGMAFLGQWLFTGDNPWPHPGSPTVTPYRISSLRAAMREAINGGAKPYLKADGPRQDVHATDFMTTVGDSMYTGNHGNPDHGTMYRYRLTDSGRLKPVAGPWAVPPRAQGMVATGDKFIFSSDNGTGRGWLTVVDRDAPARPVSCVWLPSMPEDIVNYHGRLVMAFESGAAQYAHIHPHNPITHLHNASLDSLMDLTDPATVADDPTLGGLLRSTSAMTHLHARLHDVNHLLNKLNSKG